MSSNANDNNETTASAGATPETTSAPINGYCHVCDRRVTIDPVAFTCSVCNGGFIELVDSAPAPEPEPQAPNIHRFFNDGNNPLSQLLPMLLPQLMGQVGAQNITSHRINLNQPQGQAAPGQTPGQQNASATQETPGQSTTRLQFIVPSSEPGGQVDLYGMINNVLSDLIMRPGGTPGSAPGTAPGGVPGGMPGGMPGGIPGLPGMQINFPGMQQQGAQFHFQSPPIRMFQLHGDMRDYAWGAGGLDTIITQLLNQLENTGPPPASEQQLHNLPSVKITEEDVKKNLECAICMEDFNLNEEAKKLPCKHCFHEPCITEWLKLHGTCPVCRENLNGEDTSQREYVTSPVVGESSTGEASNSEAPAQGSTPSPPTAANPTNTNTTDNNQQTDNTNPGPQVYHDMDFD